MPTQVNELKIPATINQQSSYLPSLTKYIYAPEGAYPKKIVDQAWDQIQAREYAAFGHLAGDASTPALIKFCEAYINYYNKLSPEDKESPTYKGTGEKTAVFLAKLKAKQARGEDDKDSESFDPKLFILKILKELLAHLKESLFKRQLEQMKDKLTTNGNAHSSVMVSISEEAKLKSMK